MARAIKLDLILKSREAILSAVQIFNNPLMEFKTESFIVLSMIGWMYLLHAYYKSKGMNYRYFELRGVRRTYLRNADGSFRFWDLSECLNNEGCPLDKDTVNNLSFLIGLRNQIEHQKPSDLDSYLSARYQACTLNFNYYIKKLFGEKYSLDNLLALSLQFAELDYDQAQIIKDKSNLIPPNVNAYIASFDSKLTPDEQNSERFAYRLLFTKVTAKRAGQADRVIEFLNPNSELAKTIDKEYWVTSDREKPKFSPTQVVETIQDAGFLRFKISDHTDIWKEYDAKNPSSGYGVMVVKTWYWYQNWIDFVLEKLKDKPDAAQ